MGTDSNSTIEAKKHSLQERHDAALLAWAAYGNGDYGAVTDEEKVQLYSTATLSTS